MRTGEGRSGFKSKSLSSYVAFWAFVARLDVRFGLALRLALPVELQEAARVNLGQPFEALHCSGMKGRALTISPRCRTTSRSTLPPHHHSTPSPASLQAASPGACS